MYATTSKLGTNRSSEDCAATAPTATSKDRLEVNMMAKKEGLMSVGISKYSVDVIDT